MAEPNVVRQRKPAAASQPAVVQATSKPVTLLDERKRLSDAPFAPSFSLAVRILLLMRVTGAMYSSVTADCDEIFNYWEPLHYLLYGQGFQTWEYSPAYAIRSWAYILLHAAPPRLAGFLSSQDKRPAFFALRLTFALLSTLIEARLYRSIVEHIGIRIGRYFLVFSLLSAGMWNASTALLPSSFALHLCNLALSFYIAPRHADDGRTYMATACFAIAAIVGWPFAALLGVPFVLEELFVRGNSTASFYLGRITRLAGAALVGASVALPLVGIDSYFYNKLVFVPLNIVRYNVLQNKATLYGTEPWWYYAVNGMLNFNLALPLALLALPMLVLSQFYDRPRLGPKVAAGQTSATTILAFRLLPLYLWLGVLTMQPHKEERFLFPAYGFICFNAAVTLYLIRGALERFYANLTKAPYKASRSSLYATYTFTTLLVFGVLSLARIAAIHQYYRAPESLAYYFQYRELPRLAVAADPHAYPQYAHITASNLSFAIDASGEQFNYEPLRDLGLQICWGKEWYRFPGSFIVPSVVEPSLVRSDFDGLVPRPFDERHGTSKAPSGLNDENRAELSNYVPIETCHYVVDGVYPHRAKPKRSSREQSLSNDPAWKTVVCLPLLDNENSPQIQRAIYLPIPGWKEKNAFADYCLYRKADLP